MTDIQMEEKSIKKKLLVPVVVLMLCAVTLVGAGYAYTTTVSNTGSVDGEYYAIDMYSNTDGTLTTGALTLGDKIEVYSEKAVGASTIAVKADAVSATPLCYVGAWLNSETMATNADIRMTVAASGTGWAASGVTATNSTYGITITFACADSNGDGYWEVTIASAAINYTSSNVNAHTATKAVSDALDALSFTLTFSCSGTTA